MSTKVRARTKSTAKTHTTPAKKQPAAHVPPAPKPQAAPAAPVAEPDGNTPVDVQQTQEELDRARPIDQA